MQRDRVTITIELGRGNLLHAIEREAIRQVLELCRGNVTQAAQRIGIMRQSLRRKIVKLGLSTPTPPAAPDRVQQEQPHARER